MIELPEKHEPIEPAPEAELPQNPYAGEEQVGFWTMVRRFFWLPADEKQRMNGYRLRLLNEAIEDNPQAVHYLERAHLHREAGRLVQALDDYQTAINQAQHDMEDGRWGIVPQTIRDEALYYQSIIRQQIGS